MGDEIDNFDRFLDDLEQAAAVCIQRAGLAFQQAATAAYRQGLNPPPYSNPAPRGTFPHVRTGHLASNILMRPSSLAEIRRVGYTRVGYAASAFYGIALGNRGWKWLQDVLNDNRAKAAIATVRISGRGGVR